MHTPVSSRGVAEHAETVGFYFPLRAPASPREPVSRSYPAHWLEP